MKDNFEEEVENMGVNNGDIATLGLAGAVGYGGYGNRNGEMLDKIAFDQNQSIQRDVLHNSCDIKTSELGITASTNLRAAEAQNQASIRQLQTDNKLDTIENQVCSRLTNIEQNIFKGQIESLNREVILSGQVNNRLQNEVNAFCCPKPAAIYQPLQCPTSTASAQGTSMADIVTIVNMISAKNKS